MFSARHYFVCNEDAREIRGCIYGFGLILKYWNLQNKAPSKASLLFSGTQEKCVACNKTVYPIEKVSVPPFTLQELLNSPPYGVSSSQKVMTICVTGQTILTEYQVPSLSCAHKYESTLVIIWTLEDCMSQVVRELPFFKLPSSIWFQ